MILKIPIYLNLSIKRNKEIFIDYVVYLDFKAKKLEKIINGSKTKLIRGAMGRRIPYGRVLAGDELYFIENNGDVTIKAKAIVKTVINSDKLTLEETKKLIEDNQIKLELTPNQIKR